MNSCYSCNNTDCCPEHCCDWDNCSCKDCINCGGTQEGSPKKPLDSAKPAKLSSQPPEPIPRSTLSQELSLDEYIKMKVQESLKKEREEEAKRKAKLEEERKIEREKYEAIMASTRSCIERNKQVLESTSATLSKLQDTMQGIQDVEKRYQEFKDGFGEVMRRALQNAFGSVENIEELKSKHGSPKLSNINEVARVLSKCNKVAIITGAGVSAESGVFTYKGNEEQYDIAGTLMTLQEIMHIYILETHPVEFWKNIQFNRKRFSESKPNSVHKALFDMMTRYRRKGRKVSLITQNIDGFDKVNLRNDPDFFEIHGNTHEMRCKAACRKDIFPCPDFTQELTDVPLCAACGGVMRPNVLLYGEGYTEEFYRADTASNACKDAEVLIIIGTQIKCGFPVSNVKFFGQNGRAIVEINVDPVIEYGQVYVLNQKCGEVFPRLIEILSKQLN